MTELFGLPAHALLVHAPVALAPLVVVFGVVVAWKQPLAVKWAYYSVGTSLLLAIAYFLAKESGEGLAEKLSLQKAIERHEELADQTFLISLVFVVIAVLVAVLAKRTAAAPASTSRILAVAGIVVGVLLVIWTIRTGHEGAAVTWDGWNS